MSYLITVRLQNVEGVPPDISQRHSLEQEITLALILKSHSKSAAQIFKHKLEIRRNVEAIPGILSMH